MCSLYNITMYLICFPGGVKPDNSAGMHSISEDSERSQAIGSQWVIKGSHGFTKVRLSARVKIGVLTRFSNSPILEMRGNTTSQNGNLVMKENLMNSIRTLASKVNVKFGELWSR